MASSFHGFDDDGACTYPLLVSGACTYPLLDYGACTYPLLGDGACTYSLLDYGASTLPLLRSWSPVCISEKMYQYQYHRGDLCCAYECHDIDGVLSYTAVLVTFTGSPVGF
jgi:hypothetical protein